ncbi:FAD-dependent oxidoreductase [Gordonia bronchialis]|uniref:FAD-dependent oxidoreductase n=1 Tax=Gordonia bronchialis TaxID=2054 RepID=UPI00242E6F06|nr:FAD-dependent oxidoreductase [Gordonia bronchialis]
MRVGTRVVVAGLGDTGTLCAIHLSQSAEVVGISPKPGLISGQELGMRLARPHAWAREYALGYHRYRGLDRVSIRQAQITAAHLDTGTIEMMRPDGTRTTEHFDILIIATGARNGFWRTPGMQTADDVTSTLREDHQRISEAARVAVVGGGASAVSAAANIAVGWPDKQVDLYFPHADALLGHHPRTWRRVRRRLLDAGVRLHPHHRARLPADGVPTRLGGGTIGWTTGQADTTADVVIWAVGRALPNTEWLPAEVLDDAGFVRVDPDLRIPAYPNVFAVGDVAATDPLRSSARNRADRLVAHNVRAYLADRPLRDYRPPRRRWGSVLGPQRDGLEVFTPTGRHIRFPAWSIDTVLWPWIVRRGIYRGVRPE